MISAEKKKIHKISQHVTTEVPFPNSYNTIILKDHCTKLSTLIPLVYSKEDTKMKSTKLRVFINTLSCVDLDLLEFTMKFFTPKFDIFNTNRYIKFEKMTK